MENKKDNRGRKALPKLEKKLPVTIYVKKKYISPATKECNKIQEKYENK